ncbi:hypothetical protein CRUP_024813 [Coryphaenoides rupestris]|nr:hypothetical protein CRUP_024813 [Coryphaenoides rupestris]
MASIAGDNIFLFVPNLIGYARIVLALLSFSLMPCCPLPAAFCYLLSGLLDAFDGHAAHAGRRVVLKRRRHSDAWSPRSGQRVVGSPVGESGLGEENPRGF